MFRGQQPIRVPLITISGGSEATGADVMRNQKGMGICLFPTPLLLWLLESQVIKIRDSSMLKGFPGFCTECLKQLIRMSPEEI